MIFRCFGHPLPEGVPWTLKGVDMGCTCCGGPTAVEGLCHYCTPDGPDDSVNGCDPRSWHCVCDKDCDGTACEVLIAQYRAVGISEGVPSTNILTYRRCVDSGDLSEWTDVLYRYSETDPEIRLDRRVCDVRSVSEEQMRRTVRDAMELGYVQTYPESVRRA